MVRRGESLPSDVRDCFAKKPGAAGAGGQGACTPGRACSLGFLQHNSWVFRENAAGCGGVPAEPARAAQPP